MTALEKVEVLNVTTKRIVVGPLLVWAVWEIVLVIIRAIIGPEVKLISQVGRDLAFRGFTSLAYFSAGLPVHIYVTWRGSPPDGAAGAVLGVTWWAIGFVYLLADIFDPTPRYWPELTQHLRYPPYVAIGSMLIAFVCFAQRGLWTPGGAR